MGSSPPKRVKNNWSEQKEQVKRQAVKKKQPEEMKKCLEKLCEEKAVHEKHLKHKHVAKHAKKCCSPFDSLWSVQFCFYIGGKRQMCVNWKKNNGITFFLVFLRQKMSETVSCFLFTQLIRVRWWNVRSLLCVILVDFIAKLK